MVYSGEKACAKWYMALMDVLPIMYPIPREPERARKGPKGPDEASHIKIFMPTLPLQGIIMNFDKLFQCCGLNW